MEVRNDHLATTAAEIDSLRGDLPSHRLLMECFASLDIPGTCSEITNRNQGLAIGGKCKLPTVIKRWQLQQSGFLFCTR